MKLAQQVLVNKQSREHADKVRQGAKKTLSAQIDIANRVQKICGLPLQGPCPP